MLSIIIPCKNEPEIVRMMEETEKSCPEAEIIVSSDRYGRGKGWALREGLKHAKGDHVCFIDGDFDIGPYWIPILAQRLQENDIVVGRKSLKGLWSRRVITYCSRIFIGLLFGLWIDTQTGIKLFRRAALPSWKDDSFAYDLEILSKAKRSGAKIIEVPIKVNIRKKMPVHSIIRFIKGAFRIRLNLWLKSK